MPAGRPKKMTPKRLKEGVDAFFDSISYERTVTERVNTGEKDADGHWIYIETPVKNRRGEELKITIFTQPPWLGDLYDFLAIHRSTWARWREDPKLGPVCDWADERIKSYWAKEMNGKYAAGASKMLAIAFGMSETQTVRVTGGIEEYLQKLKDAGGGEQEF